MSGVDYYQCVPMPWHTDKGEEYLRHGLHVSGLDCMRCELDRMRQVWIGCVGFELDVSGVDWMRQV